MAGGGAGGDLEPQPASPVPPRPRSATRSPPICEGVASPDIIRSKPREASSRESDAPVAALAMSALKSSIKRRPRSLRHVPAARCLAGGAAAARKIPGRGDLQKILQYKIAVLGGDALRVKLDAVHGKPTMSETHHQVIIGFGDDGKLGRQAGAL